MERRLRYCVRSGRPRPMLVLAAAFTLPVAAQAIFADVSGSSGLGPAWTLVGEDGNSKTLVPSPVSRLLTKNETRSIDEYDRLFEKYSMYCNGRWLGAQVLQDAQDLMYLQYIVYMIKPAMIVETGTYKGGLTYFFATLMEFLHLNSKILSIDRNQPDRVFDAQWFCPVCDECVRPWETEAWGHHVEFFQGWADDRDLYAEVKQRVAEVEGPVLVNLDACHEYDCVLVEITIYAPLVSVGSFLVIQDAKLDVLWGKPAVHAAIERFLEGTTDFIRDYTIAFYGYTQHCYLRRVAKTLKDVEM